MSWTIVRVQDAHKTDLENPPPPLATLCKRGVFNYNKVIDLLVEHNYELGPFLGPTITSTTDWPLTAVCYESKDREGTQRLGRIHRWPCRRTQ